MEIPFYNFNHILLIASQNRFTPDGKVHIKSFSIHESEVVLRFSEYVKSQVHCNVSEKLFNRDMDMYIKLYRGDTSCQDEVRQYFLEDAKNFLLCNDSNINLTLIYDYDGNINLVDSSEVEKVKEQMRQILDGTNSNEKMLVWLCHNCVDMNDVGEKLDNYATAYFLENGKVDV